MGGASNERKPATVEKLSNAERKENAFKETSTIIAKWAEDFQAERFSHGEKVDHASVVMYEFSAFIKERSRALLEEARTRDDYHIEGAVAKLHEFNLVNLELLKSAAELYMHQPYAVKVLEHAYPWIGTVKEWADTFVDPSTAEFLPKAA